MIISLRTEQGSGRGTFDRDDLKEAADVAAALWSSEDVFCFLMLFCSVGSGRIAVHVA